MKNLKKGFTIVELVIVIAVIGILTAILVPTFSNLIQKAHTSADIITARNMTQVLNASEIQFDTIEQVKDYLSDNGYSKNPAPAAKDNYYVWVRNSNDVIIAENYGKVAKAIWPESYANKTSSDSGEEWYRIVEDVINVTADELTVEGGYEVQTFVPTLKLNASGAVAEAVRINGLANVDLTGHTLESNFTIVSNNRGGIYIDNGTINGTYVVNVPNATLTHETNLIVNAENAEINVANHSYYLRGQFVSKNLETKGISHIVIEEKSIFEPIKVKIEDSANPTFTIKVEEEEKTLTKVDFQVESAEEKTYKVATKIENEVQKIEEKKQEELTVQEVSNETELKAALLNGGYVKMLNDITVATRINSFKPFVLDGENYVLHCSETVSGSRVFDFSNHAYNGNTYKFKNITIGAEGNALQRGISLYDVVDITLNLDNVNLNAKYYALNVASKTENITLNINNCHITGWAAINSYAVNSNYTIKNSVLRGKNFTTAEAFGVIVIDGAGLVKNDPTKDLSKDNSRNVVVNLVKSQVIAEFTNATPGRYFELFYSIQYGLDLAKYNKIFATDCEFTQIYLNPSNNEITTEKITDPIDILYCSSNCDPTNTFYWNGRELKAE